MSAVPVRMLKSWTLVSLLALTAACGGGGNDNGAGGTDVLGDPSTVHNGLGTGSGSGTGSDSGSGSSGSTPSSSADAEGRGTNDGDGDGVASSSDCDDRNTAVWRTIGVFRDADLDGFGTGDALTRCIGGATPTGFAMASGDCADDDPLKFATLYYAATDRDFDTHLVASSGSICAGAALPRGYLAAVPSSLPADALVECDDADFAIWRMVALYDDVDGDGTGSGSFTVRCIGQHAPAGFSLLGYDPVDSVNDQNSALVSELSLSSWLLAIH